MTLSRFKLFNDFPTALWKQIPKSLHVLKPFTLRTLHPEVPSHPLPFSLLGPRCFALRCLGAVNSFQLSGFFTHRLFPIDCAAAGYFFSFKSQFKRHFLRECSCDHPVWCVQPSLPIHFHSALYISFMAFIKTSKDFVSSLIVPLLNPSCLACSKMEEILLPYAHCICRAQKLLKCWLWKE